MKLADILYQKKKPHFSFEVIPPKRGTNGDNLKKLSKNLAKLGASFINVTSHGAEQQIEETPEGLKRFVQRRHLATDLLCQRIQLQHDVPAVPHLLSQGFTREETEDFLFGLNFAEIQNVMALRGDKKYDKKIDANRSTNEYASDLVKQIADMNNGIFLRDYDNTDSTDFCIGVAGYPEKHYQAPNMEYDLKWLKHKVDQGAHYIITQMFFDNTKFYDFVEKCRALDITVPIIPGLKILTRPSQLVSISEKFYCDIPMSLVDGLMGDNPQKAGIEHAKQQTEDLIDFMQHSDHFDYEPIVHYYVKGSSRNVKEVLEVFEKYK